jgi:trehalose/maltose hydrolase-like predicted phosphorylase
MDVVLGPDRTQRSQIVKQADVVALLALLPQELDRRSRIANFHYYERRCDHGSSLSRATHASVAARLGETELALRYFREAAAIDLADPPAHSAGRVHIATLGGLWQTTVFGFAGLSLLDDAVALEPHLPEFWNSLHFRVQWRGRQIRVRIERQGNLISAFLESGEPLKLVVAGKAHELFREQSLRLPLEIAQ